MLPALLVDLLRRHVEPDLISFRILDGREWDVNVGDERAVEHEILIMNFFDAANDMAHLPDNLLAGMDVQWERVENLARR